MTRYTVTIASLPGESTTTLHIETAPRPRIVEVFVRAGPEGGISSTALPPVDLDTLAAAFLIPGEGSEESAAPQPAGAHPVAVPASVPTPERTPTAATGATATAPSTPEQRHRADKAPARTATGDSGTRNYRRMPDVAELVGAYRDATSVTELARQYGVPRHTMNAWLGRLRRQGLIERR